MKMKAVSNVDTVLIIKDGIIRTKTVATFHSDSSLLEIHEGCTRYLPGALVALRSYQRERNQPTLPVRVEYW